jgi:predicted nicotinamide N-methyase
MTYDTEVIQLTIASYSIDIERVTNIDALFDDLIAKGEEHEDMKDERIPYWAELWPSALALSHYMATMDLDWKEKTVLEIGCGLGLPSVMAGKLGATNVVLSDYLAEAVDFAKANWNRNISAQAKGITVDWRSPNPDLAADVLIAADIAYEVRAFEYLAPAFKTLCKPNGVILLSEPNRAFAKIFLQQLDNEGFTIKKHQTKQSLFGVEYLINIFELRLK